jgi:hypothetical protein
MAARQPTEWDRHIRRYWALHRSHSAVMRQVIKVAWKEPETEAFLRDIADQLERARKAEAEAGWKIRFDDGELTVKVLDPHTEKTEAVVQQLAATVGLPPEVVGSGDPDRPASFYAEGHLGDDGLRIIEVQAPTIEQARTMLAGIGMGRWTFVPASSVPLRDMPGGGIKDTAGIVLDVGAGAKFYRSRS